MSFSSSVCVPILVYDITHSKTVGEPSHFWTPCDAIHARAVDATDRHEADILGHN
jgi:hypothetical protein